MRRLLLALLPIAAMACSTTGPCSIGTVWDGTPAGATQKLGGLETYVATPVTPASPPRVVLQITDIFGVHKVCGRGGRVTSARGR